MLKSEIDLLVNGREYRKLANNTIPAIAQSMVAEYERKRKAYEAKNTTFQKSGRIDTKRLVKYKVTDDIFRTNKVVPEGMSHGLFVCIDWSASMGLLVIPMAIQYLATALFAKRANIPFKISIFTTGGSNGLKHMLLADNTMTEANIKEIFYHMVCSVYTHNHYTDFKGKVFSREYQHALDTKFYMGGTPLLDAAIEVYQHAYEMKHQHAIQSMNVLFITDGCHSGIGFVNGKSYANSIVCPYTSRRYDIKNLNQQNTSRKCFTKLLSPINRMYRDSGIRVSNMFIAQYKPDIACYIDDSEKSQDYTAQEDAFGRGNAKYRVIENVASYNKMIYVKKSIFPVKLEDSDYDLNDGNYRKLGNDFIKNTAETKSLTVVCRMIVSDMCSDME